MTLGSGGAFKCEWTSNGGGSNILFRIGKRFGSTQNYKDVGNISITYNAKYSPNGTSYLSVYGWTQNPLVITSRITIMAAIIQEAAAQWLTVLNSHFKEREHTEYTSAQ